MTEALDKQIQEFLLKKDKILSDYACFSFPWKLLGLLSSVFL